jgi:DNA-nicking Smr family endonuclease
MAEKRKRERQATPEESALFHTVLKDAAPLKGKRRPQPTPVGPVEPDRVPAAPAKRVRPSAAPRPQAVPLAPPPPRAPELRHDAAPGVDRRTAERLRRGALPLEATLDLHGHTQAAARRALDGFIADSAEAGRRCVLVITGKGGRADPDDAFERATPGVLRSQVPRWLNLPPSRPRILAFAQAQPRHGGAGALYVLLKRRRAG